MSHFVLRSDTGSQRKKKRKRKMLLPPGYGGAEGNPRWGRDLAVHPHFWSFPQKTPGEVEFLFPETASALIHRFNSNAYGFDVPKK